MDAALNQLVAALAVLDDHELDALIATVNDCPQFAPGFLAWVEHVCEWEQRRREDLDFPLQPPDAAIDPSETADSIGAATVMRESFAQDKRTEAAAALFDSILAVLTGGEHRH